MSSQLSIFLRYALQRIPVARLAGVKRFGYTVGFVEHKPKETAPDYIF